MLTKDQRITFAKIILARRIRNRLKRKQRSMYIRDLFLRKSDGMSKLVMELRDDPQYHYRVFRMSKSNFDTLLDQTQYQITHCRTHRYPISSLERLAITLRYLASGDSQMSLSLAFRVSPSAISGIIRETPTALISALQQQYLPQPDENVWKTNAKRFEDVWNFPLACGSIDGKHIRVKAPPASGTLYYNYKGFFSIVLMAIANADFQFTAVDIGAYGSESDGGILTKSPMGQKLMSEKFDVPPPTNLVANGPMMPYVFLGDDAFPLKTFMMKPFKGNFLKKEERVFNYRLSRARMTVENSFGILAARWRIFHSVIEADIELVKGIVLASVLLHNFLTSQQDFNNIIPDRMDGNGLVSQGNWRDTVRNDTGMTSLPRQGSNNYRSSAAVTRKNFMNYFVSDAGKVGWQDAHVDAGL